jgi:Immunoglobulin domain/NHL repeat
MPIIRLVAQSTARDQLHFLMKSITRLKNACFAVISCAVIAAVQDLSAAVAVQGKAPAVPGITTGVVTLSNRNYVYTASFDASGHYLFPAVEPGVYCLKADINNYNQAATISVDATADVTVPDLAIERYVATAGTYQYTWIQDQSYAGLPKTEITQNVVTPVSVTILGKAYQIADIGYAQELFNKYGIVLNNADVAWNQEYAYRLYTVLDRIPQISGSAFRYNQLLGPRQWTLTADFINGDIEFGPGTVRISTAAFTYAAPFVAEIAGVRGLYFSKRLHHALVDYVTARGTDQSAVALILWDRFGLTIDTDANRLDYSQFTAEASTRFQNWFVHPAEIVQIINQFEELPEGFHKIAGFKWLVRRLDGTVNPVHPETPAIAWTNGYMEFMEVAFSSYDISSITRLILHEKAHYIYQFLLNTEFKRAWAELGGWQYTPDIAHPDYSAQGGWQTTKTTEFVSAYAHDKNPNEDFAETVSYFVKDPEVLKARSIAKYNFMRDNVMLSNSYVSVIRPDLTFTVLNLNPNYDYPGKVTRVATTVTGGANEDKTFTLEVEITPLSNAGNPANDIYMRISSPVTPAVPVATYFDMHLSSINAEKTVFRGAMVLSKHLRKGYWQMPNVTITDTVGLQRYESAILYGFKLYLDNPLEDTTSPAVVSNSSSVSLRPGTLLGHPVQIATVKFNVTENTGLVYHYTSLVPPGAYRMEQYGTGPTDGNGERTIDFYIKEFARSGRYTVNQIALKDFGLNLNYTYFKTSNGNSDGTTVNLDENAPYVDVVTPHPDTTAPDLDVNRITVTAAPTNVQTPDGESIVTIKYLVRDDAAGYGTASNLKLRDPQGIEHTYYLYHRNFYTDYFAGDPTLWEQYTQQVILPRGSVPGVWGLSQMTLGDKAGNMISYDFTETLRFDPNSTAAADLRITGDPVSRAYVPGETFSLLIQTTGGDNVTYAWYKDGVVLPTGSKAGVDKPTLYIENASKEDAGSYYCIISNSAGHVVSNTAMLTVAAVVSGTDAPVTPGNGTAFTTQPSSQTVESGQTVSFTAAASGTSPASYQWQVSTNSGGTWTNLSDNSNNSGTRTMTLTVSGVSGSMNGYNYRLVATEAARSVISSKLTLTVVAPFPSPFGVAVDSTGNLFVGDNSNNTVHLVTPAGVVSLLAGTSGQQGSSNGSYAGALFRQPRAVALDRAGNLYVADTGNSLIRKITPAGAVTTLAGSATTQGYTDATGTAAVFNSPQALVVDGSDNVYVADTANSAIRKITPSGVTSTIAGNGTKGSQDGTGALAFFNQPAGIVLDSANNLYVSDTGNDTIRKITPAGVVTTIAGVAGVGGYADGTGAVALFNQPSGLAIDKSGNLYVADTANEVIRVIKSGGAVSTLVGLPSIAGLLDGNGYHAWFNQPQSLSLDDAGNVTTLVLSQSTAIPSAPPLPAIISVTPSGGSSTSTTSTIPPASASSSGGGGGGAPSGWFYGALALLWLFRRRHGKI